MQNVYSVHVHCSLINEWQILRLPAGSEASNSSIVNCSLQPRPMSCYY